MRPWVDRLTFPSSAGQYVGHIVINLLIAADTFALFLGCHRLFRKCRKLGIRYPTGPYLSRPLSAP